MLHKPYFISLTTRIPTKTLCFICNSAEDSIRKLSELHILVAPSVFNYLQVKKTIYIIIAVNQLIQKPKRITFWSKSDHYVDQSSFLQPKESIETKEKQSAGRLEKADLIEQRNVTRSNARNQAQSQAEGYRDQERQENGGGLSVMPSGRLT